MVKKLIRCTSSCTPETLLNAALTRKDDGVLLEILDTDLHAKGIVYHASCYKNYTSPRQLALFSVHTVELEVEDDPQECAFCKLAKIVQEKFQDID